MPHRPCIAAQVLRRSHSPEDIGSAIRVYDVETFSPRCGEKALVAIEWSNSLAMFRSIEDLQEALRGTRYFASRGLATTICLALELGRPLFLEGDAGSGQTEVANVL